MPRILTPLAVLLALASAFLLYALKHDTRAIEARVQATQRAIEAAIADIAVLEAERAHLARPERIEPLARTLGLAPPVARQIIPKPDESALRIHTRAPTAEAAATKPGAAP